MDASESAVSCQKSQAMAVVQTSPSLDGVISTQPGGLRKDISTRQFIFMAMGGSIGAGLLMASSTALKVGGPAALVLGFLIVGIAVCLTMGSLGELASAYPTTGSFYDYSVMFISPSWGFSMGWNYIINFILIVPFEVTVMTLVAQYWNPHLSSAILIPIFLFGLGLISALGAKWYGEAEHGFGLLKITMLVAFSATAVVIAAGGVSTDPRQGTGLTYWQDGAFVGGATSFLWVFMAAGLAFGGTEMLGLTVAECQEPKRVMPLAFKVVGFRIIFLYLLPLTMMGFVIGPDTFATVKDLPRMSPFVLAVRAARIPVLPDIFNAVILAAVFSMANASVFASSRALRAICANGMGPGVLGTTKRGIPVYALAVVFTVSLIAFLNSAPNGHSIFDWLLALASASNFFTWGSINVAQIRLRLAIRKQGKDADEILGWKSPCGIWGSAVAILITAAGLISLIVSAALPPKGLSESSPVIVGVQNSLGICVVLVMWLGHMAWTSKQKKPYTLWIPLDKIDLSKRNTVVEDTKVGSGKV